MTNVVFITFFEKPLFIKKTIENAVKKLKLKLKNRKGNIDMEYKVSRVESLLKRLKIKFKRFIVLALESTRMMYFSLAKSLKPLCV